MPKLSLALAALLVLASACGLLTEPQQRDGLSVQKSRAALLLSNRGEQPIYYFAVERETAALIFWGACDDPERCARVEPRARQSLPLDSIYGYAPGTEHLIVYWWRLVPKAEGGFRADSIRTVNVPM